VFAEESFVIRLNHKIFMFLQKIFLQLVVLNQFCRINFCGWRYINIIFTLYNSTGNSWLGYI